MIDIQSLLMGMIPYVQYVSFGLLLLAGLNLPVSEDIVFIVSASLAATIVPENTFYIFAGCFLGAFMSDLEAYLIGRFAIKRMLSGTILNRLNIFNSKKLEQKIETVRRYFLKYGGKTLFAGRFIPFGVRNVLFMTSGLIHMNIIKFIIIDLCALICTSTILFSLGYSFGNKLEHIFPYLNRYKLVIVGIFVAGVILVVIRNRYIKRELPGPNVLMDANPSKNALRE